MYFLYINSIGPLIFYSHFQRNVFREFDISAVPPALPSLHLHHHTHAGARSEAKLSFQNYHIYHSNQDSQFPTSPFIPSVKCRLKGGEMV